LLARLLCSQSISLGEKQKIYRTALFIDSSIKINPFTIQLDVRLVRPPASIGGLLALGETLVNKTNKAIHPFLQSRMVNLGTTNRHHFFQIPVTQAQSTFHINKQHN
jgi:hypothetical protein